MHISHSFRRKGSAGSCIISDLPTEVRAPCSNAHICIFDSLWPAEEEWAVASPAMCKSENVQQHSLNYMRSTDLSMKLFHRSRGMPSLRKPIQMQKHIKAAPGINGSMWITQFTTQSCKEFANSVYMSLYYDFRLPVLAVYLKPGVLCAALVPFFGSAIIMQDHNNNSSQRQLQRLGFMTLVCHSWAAPLWIHAGKVKSASISHIYIWSNDSPVGWLWPSKYSTWCNQRWCIVLVGYRRWWLTQYDTWFHSLIAALGWIGHKPTEPSWPWGK